MAYHRVRPGTRVRLGRIDPADTGKHADEAAARAKLGQDVVRLAKLQDVLYAERRHAVLVVLQGMDTSGKDGWPIRTRPGSSRRATSRSGRSGSATSPLTRSSSRAAARRTRPGT